MIRILLFLGFVSALAAQVPLNESDKESLVEVLVVDPNGVPVRGDVKISLQRLIPGKDGQLVAWDGRTKVKYGTYRLIVRGSPAYPVEKIVKVNEPRQLFLVGLFPAPIELPWVGNTVHGRLSANTRQRGCRWVRLISPVAEGEYADASALDSGDFVFENIKPGKYLLITIGAEGVCEVTQTSVEDKRIQDLKIW